MKTKGKCINKNELSFTLEIYGENIDLYCCFDMINKNRGDEMRGNSDSRREEITKYILANEKGTVDDLAEKYQVTKETIRSDLNFLELKGLVYRTHGGAVLRNANTEIPMDLRQQEQSVAKKQIAYEAINYITDDMVLFIDPSSTVLPLGRLLRMRKNCTVFTNSYELVPYVAGTQNKVILVGGEYWSMGKRTVGSFVRDMLQDIYFDMVILGMEGCKGLTGPGTNVLDTLSVNKHVIAHSKQLMLLADYTKFDKEAGYQFCDFRDADFVITNPLREEVRSGIRAVKIIEAKI